MMISRLAACLIALAAASPLAARAQTPDPEALTASRELFEAAFSSGLLDKLVDQTWPSSEAMIKQVAPQISPEKLAELKKTFTEINREQLNDTMQAAPAIYAKYFTAAELRDMLAFYRTETGKKSLEVMPALAGELTQTTMAKLPDMMRRVMEAFTRALKDEGIALPAGKTQQR
jgi:hypothetical protein